MPEKTKVREKMRQFCEGKSSVVKIAIFIFLSYFVEKVFLNFMFKGGLSGQMA